MVRPPRKLLIATHNPGKLAEFTALLAPLGVETVGAAALHLAAPAEPGGTFPANALIKAQAGAAGSGLPALADDSGLCVAALNGAPGVDSALWAGQGRNFRPAFDRIERETGGTSDLSAHFACVLALAWPDSRLMTFEGRVDGHLVFPPRGDGGHGYDPIFVPNGSELTFAEMEKAAKNAISHRARALIALVSGVFAGG